MIKIEGVPENVTHEQVLGAVRSLGFEPERIRALRLSVWTVEAEVYSARPLQVRGDRDEAVVHTVVYALHVPPDGSA